MDASPHLPRRLTEQCAALLDVGDGHFKPTLASAVLDGFEGLAPEGQLAFFRHLHGDLGAAPAAVDDAIARWRDAPSQQSAQRLHAASESPRQALLRALNLAEDGTFRLVSMRSRFLEVLAEHPELEPVDQDFLHLFRSWFNAGFLKLHELSWDSPSSLVEHVLEYESVHPLGGWADLRSRLQPVDRQCFAFLHPSMGDRPLIFVEVAATEEIPSSTDFITDLDRAGQGSGRTVTTLYSINNTFPGLRGIPFGNHLIKQVLAHVRRHDPEVTTFVTLSPVPGFRRWLETRPAGGTGGRRLAAEADAALRPGAPAGAVEAVRPAIVAAARSYLLESTDGRGRPLDRVARFHLRNGAVVDRINWPASTEPHVLDQSVGLMVNYLYDAPSGSDERARDETERVAVPASRAAAAAHRPTTTEETT
ncbi:malonyl-CoA decarboxylase family protein [Kocuria sp. CPCC 205292]|uniref:malonyl-CoA decarboxylase domain-containing protein n=1 Tax=Kocuria cellulosilytica TaxID=3071451 RepID=UPI0034D7AE87